MWEICKKLPGDLLDNFDIVKQWNFCDNLQSNWGQNQILESGDNIGIIAHEMGHAIDRMKLNLSQDTKLMKIFNREKEKFYNIHTFSGGVDSMYHLFDEYNDAREIVAETNMLLTTPGNDLYRTTRAQILAHYFPESIGYIANNLYT